VSNWDRQAAPITTLDVITYDGDMARWEPNAEGRLEQAALELFAERGYEQTTVEDIAARAGLTKRTFFRYFVDKREVLFARLSPVAVIYVTAIAAAPSSATPMEAATAGLRAVASDVESRGEIGRTRQAVVAAHPELQERELLKRSEVAERIAEALRARNVAAPIAALTAEVTVAVFKVAYADWGVSGRIRLTTLVERLLGTLPASVAGDLTTKLTTKRT
jgi:AcrR family transcriptional regulator